MQCMSLKSYTFTEQSICVHHIYVLLFFPGDSPSHLYHSDSNERGPLLRHSLPFEISPPPHTKSSHDRQHLHLDWYVLLV